MHTRPAASLAIALSVAAAHADTAFFSADGKSVTFITRSGDSICTLDTETGKVAKLTLSAGAEKESLTSVCRGGDGEILLTTDTGVYVHDAKGTRKLAAAPVKGDWPIMDLAAAPAKAGDVGDWLFLSGNDGEEASRRVFYARKPGAKGFEAVFCRRVNKVGAAAFTADGRLFFSAESDLWEGSFTPLGDGDKLVLNGVRIAPLAVLNTDEANSGSMHVEQVMVAGASLYVRLRGHHMGEIVRLPIPPAATTTGGEEGARSSTAAAYRIQAGLLAKAQVITTDQEAIQTAAATAAGGVERLFYNNGAQLFLWDARSGKAKEVGSEE